MYCLFNVITDKFSRKLAGIAFAFKYTRSDQNASPTIRICASNVSCRVITYCEHSLQRRAVGKQRGQDFLSVFVCCSMGFTERSRLQLSARVSFVNGLKCCFERSLSVSWHRKLIAPKLRSQGKRFSVLSFWGPLIFSKHRYLQSQANRIDDVSIGCVTCDLKNY